MSRLDLHVGAPAQPPPVDSDESEQRRLDHQFAVANDPANLAAQAAYHQQQRAEARMAAAEAYYASDECAADLQLLKDEIGPEQWRELEACTERFTAALRPTAEQPRSTTAARMRKRPAHARIARPRERRARRTHSTSTRSSSSDSSDEPPPPLGGYSAEEHGHRRPVEFA